MKWLKGYIAVIILIIAAYVYAEYRRPPVVDWSMTLSRYDRIPFGTYILHDQLKNLFKTGSEDLRVPLYDHLNDRADTGELCIIIAPGIKTTRTDEAELLRHISLGNTVFMATETLSKSLEDTLGVSLRAFRIKDLAWDSVSLRLVNPAFGKKNKLPYAEEYGGRWLRKFRYDEDNGRRYEQRRDSQLYQDRSGQGTSLPARRTTGLLELFHADRQQS